MVLRLQLASFLPGKTGSIVDLKIKLRPLESFPLGGSQNVGSLQGGFVIELCFDTIGEFVIDVFVLMQKIGSLRFRVQPAVLAATAKRIMRDSDPFPIAGDVCRIPFELRDPTSQLIRAGCENLSATIAVDLARTRCRLAEVQWNDGYISVVFIPTESKPHFLLINVAGVSVGGSPFQVDVLPAALSPQHCSLARSSAEQATSLVSFALETFILQPCDKFGNSRADSEEDYTVEPTIGLGKAQVQVCNMANRCKRIVVTPMMLSGVLELSLRINGIHIALSPLRLEVKPASGVSAGFSILRRPPRIVQCGAPFSVEFGATDGNRAIDGSAESLCCPVLVEIRSQNCDANVETAPIVTIDAMEDGAYRAQCTVSVAGAYTMHAAVEGLPIRGSPIHFQAVSGPDGSKCSAVGVDALNGCEAGAVYTVTIHTRDRCGRECESGGAVVAITLRSPSGRVHRDAQIQDRGDGAYVAKISCTEAGASYMTMQVNDVSLPNSPLRLDVLPGPAVGPRCIARSAFGETCPLQRTNMLFETRDAHDNVITSGGAVVSVSVFIANGDLAQMWTKKENRGQCSSYGVDDLGDGTYCVWLTPEVIRATLSVAVTVNSTPLSGSPYTVSVKPRDSGDIYEPQVAPGLQADSQLLPLARIAALRERPISS